MADLENKSRNNYSDQKMATYDTLPPASCLLPS